LIVKQKATAGENPEVDFDFAVFAFWIGAFQYGEAAAEYVPEDASTSLATGVLLPVP
jgi:hypothetical protein